MLEMSYGFLTLRIIPLAGMFRLESEATIYLTLSISNYNIMSIGSKTFWPFIYYFGLVLIP